MHLINISYKYKLHNSYASITQRLLHVNIFIPQIKKDKTSASCNSIK